MNNSLRFIPAILAICSIFACDVFAQDESDVRVWISKDGRVTVRAFFDEFVGDDVRLRRENGETFVTEPDLLSDADQDYLKKLRLTASLKSNAYLTSNDLAKEGPSVSLLRARERKLIFAKDILALYEEVSSEGGITVENAVFVGNKISKFRPLADVEAVDFLNEFVPKSEVASRRAKSKALVNEWIDAARAAKGNVRLDKLRDATESDPISLDAAILEGMYHYFFARDYKKAMRSFKDAIARGEQYRVLHESFDKSNRVVALNACAVLSIRSQNCRKSVEYLDEILSVSEGAPQVLDKKETGQNLARIARLARLKNAGIDVKKSESRQFKDLFQKYGVNVGGANGWVFAFPFNEDGQHSNLSFLLGKYAKGVIANESNFEDFVCILCEGGGQIRCPNDMCNQGLVKIPFNKPIEKPDGSIMYIRQHYSETCKVCSGNSRVRCWGCDASGVQRK